MDFKEMKTVTLLMQPEENGWLAVHKKYKHYYGRMTCTEGENGIEVQTDFGGNDAERREAVDAAVGSLFETSDAEQVTVDGEIVTRESWQAAQDALYARADTDAPEVRPATLRMIPYNAFANRGESDMLVWFAGKI